MRHKIFELKKYINEIESYMYNNNTIKIKEIANKINEISNDILNENTDEENEIIDNNNKDIDGLEFISTLPFLYKPVMKKNFYEGDYLEKFSLQRTDELKRSNSFDIHNKFWFANEIENGNIFGSIPLELIKKESMRLLISYGWEEASVNVYKFKDNFNNKKMLDICLKKFSHYLLIKEKKNKENFILEFIIKK